MAQRKYPKPIWLDATRLDVNQPAVCGWEVSWNPDDERFYISRANGEVRAVIKDWRNVCQYCNTHKD